MSQQALGPFIDFFLYEQGVIVEVNGDIQKALLKNATESVRYHNDKYIVGTFGIKTGDYVKTIDPNEFYLTISEIDQRSNHVKARLRRCNRTIVKEKPGEPVIIGFDEDGRPIVSTGDPTFIIQPAIIENTVLDIETSYQIVVPNDEVIAVVQENEETLEEFQEGIIFSVLDKSYQIYGIDRFKPGLLYIKAKWTAG